MRILHVIPTLGGGGAERQLGLLAPALCAGGLDVHIAYLADGEYRQKLADAGVGLHRLAVRSHRDPRLPQRLHGTLRRIRPAIVHTWLPVMDAIGGAVAVATGVTWLLSERTVAAAYARPSLTTWLRARLARGAAGVVGNSRLGLEQWRDVFPPGRRFLVPNALPLAEIEAAPALPRASLSLDPSAPLLVYAGRFAPEKNIGVLVEALCTVTAGGAVALLCGDGPERAAAEAAVRRAGLAERIRFTGYRRDLWPLLKAADVALSLSRFEGTPNVVLEAAACGTPLLLSDIPAHRELFDAATADFVNATDALPVADALRRVLADAEGARRRAAAAQKRVREREPQAAAAALRDAYEAVLGGNAARPRQGSMEVTPS